MFKTISNIKLIIFCILLFLSVAVVAREVIVVGNSLVSVKTITESCYKLDCCNTFYEKYKDYTYIINTPVVTTIGTTSYNAAWSHTQTEIICSIKLIIDELFLKNY
jgi:hypothetical protein